MERRRGYSTGGWVFVSPATPSRITLTRSLSTPSPPTIHPDTVGEIQLAEQSSPPAGVETHPAVRSKAVASPTTAISTFAMLWNRLLFTRVVLSVRGKSRGSLGRSRYWLPTAWGLIPATAGADLTCQSGVDLRLDVITGVGIVETQ